MITAPVGSLSGTYDEDDTSTDDTTTDDTTTDDGGGSWDAPTATDGFGRLDIGDLRVRSAVPHSHSI